MLKSAESIRLCLNQSDCKTTSGMIVISRVLPKKDGWYIENCFLLCPVPNRISRLNLLERSVSHRDSVVAQSLKFAHRCNPDGSVDSICYRCFATVATAKVESELHRYEQQHVCASKIMSPLLRGTLPHNLLPGRPCLGARRCLGRMRERSGQ